MTKTIKKETVDGEKKKKQKEAIIRHGDWGGRHVIEHARILL